MQSVCCLRCVASRNQAGPVNSLRIKTAAQLSEFAQELVSSGMFHEAQRIVSVPPAERTSVMQAPGTSSQAAAEMPAVSAAPPSPEPPSPPAKNKKGSPLGHWSRRSTWLPQAPWCHEEGPPLFVSHLG